MLVVEGGTTEQHFMGMHNGKQSLLNKIVTLSGEL
jgi:hypothetical protein